jgi:hypothetical protein
MKNLVKVVYDNFSMKKRATVFLNGIEVSDVLSLDYSADLNETGRIITKVALEFYADCVIESEMEK